MAKGWLNNNDIDELKRIVTSLMSSPVYGKDEGLIDSLRLAVNKNFKDIDQGCNSVM
jgi:hypothetical protein